MPRREPLLLPGEAAEGHAHRLTKDERLKEEDGGARGGRFWQRYSIGTDMEVWACKVGVQGCW